MARKSKAPEGGANWMDTYGDMVTLLLCFFVLLYSMSTIDSSKWIMIVKSFNPDAKESSQIVTEEVKKGEDDVAGTIDAQAEIDKEFDDLYQKLKKAVEQGGLTSEVDLVKGDGYTFVRFRDSVFFDGDVSNIRPEGQDILGKFAGILDETRDAIQEVQVLGHTSQGEPDRPNEPEFDRSLAAVRAARVTAFLQTHTHLEPGKYTSVGYGQFRPIAPFDTFENRAKNRRVEMLVTKNEAVTKTLEQYYQEVDKALDTAAK